ncbi:hypothetical protein [Sphingomonas sp.]|uniref:hypothetical protein n=1 Tax=Sphingomonas sp. TaxID=28214 RepID=UPI002E2F0FCA|nr:hypothetical protein [Sphingomonas sp.]HEX4695876.1 hypothetical protein [Sphingomonas sp.]
MRELVRRNTFESFRVPALDCASRLVELGRLCDDVIGGKIPAVAIESAIVEFSEYLHKDPILFELYPNEIKIFQKTFAKQKINEREVHDLRRFLIGLSPKISVLDRSVIEDKIIEVYGDKKNRIALDELVTIYCSVLINHGYSRSFIGYTVFKRFFSEQVHKIEKRTLKRFFSQFNDKKHAYEVITPISDSLAAIIEVSHPFGRVRSIEDLPDHARESIIQHAGYSDEHKYLVYKTEALDQFNAIHLVGMLLSTIASSTILARRGADLKWYKHSYVKLYRATAGRIYLHETPLLQRKVPRVTKSVARDMGAYTRKIFRNFERSSTLRLMNALNMAALSGTSANPENQITSLWSSVEALLSEPPAGTARISHYVEQVIPLICFRYQQRYAKAIFDELVFSYRKRMNKFFKDNNFVKASPFDNFIDLMFIPDNKQYHQEWCNLFSNNPLALYRLWRLHKKFGLPADYQKSLAEHENRVRWQLHRIYRVRNLISHSGNVPTYILPLVMNAYEYLSSAINTLLDGRAEGGEATIDGVVATINLDYLVVRDRLLNLQEFSADDMQSFYL